MKTLGPNSPLVPILMQGVIETSNLANKQQLLAMLQQAMQPNPQVEQMKQAEFQLQAGLIQAQTNDLASRAQKQMAEAQQVAVETQLLPEEIKAKQIAALSTNLQAGEADDREFERRVKVADLMLKEKNIDLKEQDLMQNREIVKMQMQK